MIGGFPPPLASIGRFLRQLWAIIGLYSLVQRILPTEISSSLRQRLLSLQERLNLFSEVLILNHASNSEHEFNPLYWDAETYLAQLQNDKFPKNLLINSGVLNRNMVKITPGFDELVKDSFHGTTLWWKPGQKKVRNKTRAKYGAVTKWFSIKAKNADENLWKDYLKHVVEVAKRLTPQSIDIRIHFNYSNSMLMGNSTWVGCPFRHHSTFDTIALDPPLRHKIIKDLNRFKESKEFYGEIGRPWKRGYFIYGPPGTGKSSLVAAIANHMKYHIYHLDLGNAQSNTDLNGLLGATEENGVIVVENMERYQRVISRNAQNADGSKVTLSGVLNFTDGIRASSGNGRIIIFTAKSKDTIDPALLRPGRMDVHIELSFCSFLGFRSLAKKYLGIKNHSLFRAVEERMQSGAKMTPAEIVNVWPNVMGDPAESLQALISALDAKLKENETNKQSETTLT